ncbi:hypothetical protein BEP19_16725 [Ammoniphilus oxalaticus]|uniref:Ribbon-helix-helix protein CopG domain-containing protein n=1 Tax=Ammoniphilus oxalaticus TaxID=66863 RepID=A0A419SPZ9_9BACL|nr:hypothetical protein [Ammoniphilus oxalaticus]RKD26482.1 hypothetical protein BEP19_16725 [Ammoniphilus oxalaticus]
MSNNFKDKIKNKVRSSAHEQLIEPVHANVNRGKKREKFEDRYSRQTVWIENEIIELITREAQNERGEKTRIFNEALRQYFKI